MAKLIYKNNRNTLDFSQGRFGGFSHGSQNAYDETFGEPNSLGVFIASVPYICKARGTYGDGSNYIVFQTEGKVESARSGTDYFTIEFLHMNSFFWGVGQSVSIGRNMAQEGTSGVPPGADHLHISIKKGAYSQPHYGNGNQNIENVFFLPRGIKIGGANSGSLGYNFLYTDDTNSGGGDGGDSGNGDGENTELPKFKKRSRRIVYNG